jgi:hypothetical protein
MSKPKTPDAKKPRPEPKPDAKKPKSEPQPERDLDAKVDAWLDGQGYPLEMRVARVFYSRKFLVEQSTYYLADQGKPREIDVVAAATVQLWSGEPEKSDSAYLDVEAVIECKSSPRLSLPWVVFTGPVSDLDRTHEEAIGYHLVSDVGKSGLAVEVLGASERVKMHEHPILMIGERLGHGIRCANIYNEKDNADIAYEAVVSLIDAAHASKLDVGDDSWIQITLPVLVVSTPLYECWLDQDGKRRLERRNYLKLLWRRPSGQHTDRLMVHVLHEDGVAEFADNVVDLVETLSTQYKNELIMAAQFALAESRKNRG